MDSVYEDVRSILENRRIRSEILQQMKSEKILLDHPEIASLEQQIASAKEQMLLESLEGNSSDRQALELKDLEKKKADLLSSFGVDPKDFQAVPFCSKCGDTGYVVKTTKDGQRREELCECIRSLLAPVMLSRSGVEKYPGYSFDEGAERFYESAPAMQELYGKLRQLAGKGKVPNAVFYGSSGKGKTFTAVAIAREYARSGRSAMVIRQAEAQELMMEHRKVIQSFYTPRGKEKEVEKKVGYLTECDILVLDDLGVEARTANTEADLLNLLDTRILSGKTTIITTNYDMESLKERYGGRFFDRIDRNFRLFPFSGSEKAL